MPDYLLYFTEPIPNSFSNWSHEDCVFPFTYDGMTYKGCTKVGGYSTPWCSHDATYDGSWDYCTEEQGKHYDFIWIILVICSIGSFDVCQNIDLRSAWP